jgi:putative addiction module component (TIGR02574 family)
MTPSLESLGIDRMSVAERLALAEAIWESIAPQIEAAPLTDAQKAEIDRRLTAHEANPGAAIPWEEVEAAALARLQQQ